MRNKGTTKKNLQIDATFLLECADCLESLYRSNQAAADQADNFYTGRMAGKAAQTYKHCAAFLRGKYEEIIATRSTYQDRQVRQRPFACPIRDSRFRTKRHHRRRGREMGTCQAINHQYRDRSHSRLERVLSKICQRLLGNNKSLRSLFFGTKKCCSAIVLLRKIIERKQKSKPHS